MSRYLQDRSLTSRICRLSLTLTRGAEVAFRRRVGLSASEWPLAATIAVSGPMNSGQLSERLGRDKAQVSRDLKALVKRGLLSKHREQGDGRFVLVQFAPEAEAVRQEVLSILDERYRHLLDGFTEAEVRTLEEMFVQLEDNGSRMEQRSKTQSDRPLPSSAAL